MTEAEELFATFQKFWRSGKNARLNVECEAGKVWASLHVSVDLPQPSPHQKRSSPSRLRRRARRAATRAHAAGQAAASEVITVDNSKDDETVDSLEKAGADQLHTVAQTVYNQSQQKAVQARPTANGSDADSAADVVESDEEELVHPISKLNVLARPWPSGQQLEIHQDSKPIVHVHVPSNQCEKCGKTFGSNRALRNHVTREHEYAGYITNDTLTF